jgi:hypothetical protein
VGSLRKILIVHQDWRPPGGANTVAAWVVEALKSHYALTLLTWNRVNTEEINHFYGTSIRPTDFAVICPNRLLRTLFKLDPDAGSLQPTAYLMRTCHRIRHHYDLVMGVAVEEMDLGGPGLLYVHYEEEASAQTLNHHIYLTLLMSTSSKSAASPSLILRCK